MKSHVERHVWLCRRDDAPGAYLEERHAGRAPCDRIAFDQDPPSDLLQTGRFAEVGLLRFS
jgi:hypothetical protein